MCENLLINNYTIGQFINQSYIVYKLWENTVSVKNALLFGVTRIKKN